MRAVVVRRFGGPDVLVTERVPDPEPGPGEAVVATAFADVLFLDTVIRSGNVREFFPARPPYVPGNGISGEVIAVGADVDKGILGARVAGRTGGDGGQGGYAEQAAIPAADLIRVPDAVDLAIAAALLHDGVTALGLMEATGARAHETVVVLGAAGGLGILLVQYAAAAGARVIGAVRGQPKRELALGAGAVATVDYSDPGWADQIVDATGGAGPDVVFDGIGARVGAEAFALVAPGGRFSAHGAPGGGFAVIDPAEAARRQITVRGIEQVQFGPADRVRLAKQALADAAGGRIQPVVGQVFALEAAADAHRAIEDRRVVAKTLLEASLAGRPASASATGEDSRPTVDTVVKST